MHRPLLTTRQLALPLAAGWAKSGTGSTGSARVLDQRALAQRGSATPTPARAAAAASSQR